jgi:lipoprotein
MMMFKRYFYPLSVLLLFVSCQHYAPVFRLTPIKQIDQNNTEYSLSFHNKTSQYQHLYFNEELLDLSCCAETADQFIIENQDGAYRAFCDYEKIFQNKEIQDLAFEFIFHCSGSYRVSLKPKELRTSETKLIINNRLLKVTKDDKKVRLHFLYKIKSKEKEYEWSSEWIKFK